MTVSAVYEFDPHCFCGNLFGKAICHKCGLVWLRNPLTDLARKLGCNHRDHPSWAKSVHQFTKHNGDIRE